jgi:hypothetical protein
MRRFGATQRRNEVNTPGFTASASLCHARRRYRATANHHGASAHAGTVLPQLSRQGDLLQCLQRCNDFDADPACQVTCFRMSDIRASDDYFGDGGNGDGGGVVERCRPRCGRRVRDGASETGGSITCIAADCSEYERAC